MPDLSIIIPARNEKYLGRTVQNLLENTNKNTEIVVVLDGWTPEPDNKPIDNRVRYFSFEKSIGQRQSINYAASRSDSRFFCKLDAHCAVDKDFDLKMMGDCEPDWTVVPRMYNLDVTTWKPKLHKRTDYMYISSPWAEKSWRAMYYEGKAKDDFRHQPKSDKLIDDTMCIMGPCYFMLMDRFWELGGEDENHGGWGQQGIEKAMKAWISGGRMVVNKKTWFSHWFRGGGVPVGDKAGFPYRLTNKKVQRARDYSKDLWLNDKWPLAKRKLQWVVEKFDPPGWQGDRPPGKWYQEATICGCVMPTERKKDTSGKRWETYIRPLLKHGEGKFIDLGCNAGFYCRKALDLGYEAIGVERDKVYIEHARYWEKKEPEGVEIIEKDVREYDIPLSSVVLLANVHYWLTDEELKDLVRKLRGKTSKVVIVGRHAYNPVHASKPDLPALKKAFQGWVTGEEIKGKKHYSISFENPLMKTVDTNEFFKTQQPSKSERFYPSFKKMIETGDAGEYREYLKWRKFKKPESIIAVHNLLIKSIKEEGILTPLFVEGDKLVDGDHRLIIAQVLGINRLTTKQKEDNDTLEGWQKYR
ncbi:MAG: glycosyltransferase [PVC group bacterium]|nr:glycosyltransferase [PVC group bacterium]